MDPNNADAYNYLATTEIDIDKSIEQYKKAIELGEKVLGKKFIDEERGRFGEMIETQPYMRAKTGLADCLYAKNEVDKAIEIYEELLELDADDNQGIRYYLSTLLLGIEDLTKFERFIDENQVEDCAVWNYNNALYSFKKLGQTTKNEKILLQAYKSNEFVIDYMLGNKEMPEDLPEYIEQGDENEAIAYANGARLIWNMTNGAFDWIKNFKQKVLKMD